MSVANKLGLGPKRVVTRLRDGRYEVKVTPPAFITGRPSKTLSVILTEDQHFRYVEWRSGKGYIQDQLGDLSVQEREILMSGTPL